MQISKTENETIGESFFYGNLEPIPPTTILTLSQSWVDRIVTETPYHNHFQETFPFGEANLKSHFQLVFRPTQSSLHFPHCW